MIQALGILTIALIPVQKSNRLSPPDDLLGGRGGLRGKARTAGRPTKMQGMAMIHKKRKICALDFVL